MSKRRPSHNYSEDTKKMCLELTDDSNTEGRVAVTALTRQRNVPSRRTIQYWRHNEQHPHTPSSPPQKKGPKSKLNLGEIYVVGGWILERDAEHKIVSGNNVIDFIMESFEEKVVKSTVSKYLAKISFASHSAKVRDPKYNRPGLAKQLLSYAVKLRRELREVPDSRIVCVDVCKFSSYSLVLRTYSPIGKKKFFSLSIFFYIHKLIFIL
jgi:hypothetical protein